MAVFTSREITFPIPKKQLSDYSEGDIVLLNESGSSVEFYVAKHNYESGLNGMGRTLLVRKGCYNLCRFGDSNNYSYSGSDLDVFLNGTYKALLDDAVQTAIGTTEFYYTAARVYSVTTINRSVFQLSATELGGGNGTYQYNTEGTKLPIADNLRIAYYNGAARSQWTRTLLRSESSTSWNPWICSITNGGGLTTVNMTTSNTASRPAFTLSDSVKFNSNTNEFVKA